MPLVVVPFTIGINSSAFGTKYFSSFPFFLSATLLTAICFSIFFILCGVVAVEMKKRFPLESQLSKRLTLIIITFLIMSGLFLVLLFNLFTAIKYFDYSFNEEGFVWAYFGLGIINVFLTFLMEGIARYESWKQSRIETEQLKTAYQRSRLQGLRSQVNPHFLFNSLNSLSSLISEDEEKAEKFLDEMSKVYRYMLRNESDTLVRLEEELKFLESYNYLLQSRYGSGLQLKIDVPVEVRSRYLPPLALQTIIENAFTQNTINKNNPLVVTVSTEKDEIIVRNNVQPKTITDDFEVEAGLDNLLSKYNLLSEKGAFIEETARERIIRLPLLKEAKEVAV